MGSVWATTQFFGFTLRFFSPKLPIFAVSEIRALFLNDAVTFWPIRLVMQKIWQGGHCSAQSKQKFSTILSLKLCLATLVLSCTTL